MLQKTEPPSERPGKVKKGKKKPAGGLRPWTNRQRGLVILAVLVVLGGIGTAGYFGIKHGYAWLRERQVDRNLESAQVAVRTQDWLLARNLARRVLLERPADFEAFLLWYRALSELNEPRTYMAAIQLFMDQRATREQRLDALRVMCLQAPQAVALSAYASLEESYRESAEARASISEVLLLRGEIELAESMVRNLPDLNEHPRARLILLRALCAIPSPDRVSEARRIFADLIRTDESELALAALVVLGETPGGLASGEPLPRLPEWVQRQPKAADLHHLLALHPSLEILPSAAESIFTGAIDRFLPTDPGVLGSWLVRHDRADQAIRILEEPAQTRPDAYIARLHALVREKRMDEVAEQLLAPPPTTDPLALEFLHLAVARAQGNHAAETAAWNRAMSHALLDTAQNRFIEIAQSAERMGAIRVAERAWVAALRVGWGRLPLYNDLQALFFSLAQQNRTFDLFVVYRALLRFEPQNIDLQNNFHYMALLHGVIQPGEVFERFKILAEENPTKPELFSAMVLAALMANEPHQAEALLPRVEESERVSPMMRRALTGVTLTMMDRDDEGRAMLEPVDWKRFLNQENMVFRRLLQDSQIRNLSLPELESPPEIDDIENSPAWKKAMERLERDRTPELLPFLPLPRIPSNEPRPLPNLGPKEASPVEEADGRSGD
jgi:hypothetical protein